ncbi:hypothetical protein GCM10009827_033070 [Dactylosporangium maewongense]|uniref:Uncharacterized protein n=1 Tax=Dactylosporangium maewongense TaxID=634393 RepID=A0ABP4L366_9ACTN
MGAVRIGAQLSGDGAGGGGGAGWISGQLGSADATSAAGVVVSVRPELSVSGAAVLAAEAAVVGAAVAVA